MAKQKAVEITEAAEATAGVSAELIKSEPQLEQVAEVRVASGISVGHMIKSGLTVGLDGIVAMAVGPHGILITIEGRDKQSRIYCVPFAQVHTYRLA